MSRQSAPKAAQSDFNPRILMAKVMKENKTAGKDACLVRFEKLLGGPFTGYLHETVLYTARLLYDYVLAEEQKDRAENDPRPEPTARQVEADRAQGVASAKARVQALAPIMFLKLPTPLGKPLGELTGKEGRKLGGWIGEVFRDVPNNKKLGDVKTQNQLKVIWEKHTQ